MKTFTFTLLFTALTGSVFATQDKSTLRLRLTATSGYLDETVVFFDQDISPAYNSSEDVAKVFSYLPGVPALFTYTSDSVKCSTNGFGSLSTTTEIVPVGYMVDVSGTYKLTASSVNNFDPTSIILLEDKQLGTYTDLRANFYQVQLDSGDLNSDRFSIIVSYPASFSSTNSGCNNNDGTIKVNFDSSIQWDYIQIVDANNNPVTTASSQVGKMDALFGALAEGDYTVNFIYGSYEASRSFHLTGNHVVASIGTPGQPILTFEQVTFNANSTHANQFAWDFGEGTVINGVANPTLDYLQSGTFTVTLRCSNEFGCSATAQATVAVAVATAVQDQSSKDISVYAHGMSVVVNMNDVLNDGTEVRVYNLLGETVYTHAQNIQKQAINMDGQPNGYYLVSVKNAGQLSTSRVFLSK